MNVQVIAKQNEMARKCGFVTAANLIKLGDKESDVTIEAILRAGMNSWRKYANLHYDGIEREHYLRSFVIGFQVAFASKNL